MKIEYYLFSLLLCMPAFTACKDNHNDEIEIFPNGDPGLAESGTRDPYLQPFSSYSIWNMPIGSNATYVDAHLDIKGNFWLGNEDECIILTPNEELIPVYVSPALWDWNYGTRCLKTNENDNPALYLPIPKSFRYDFSNGTARLWGNACSSILKSDGVTVVESQPLAKCTDNEAYTSQWRTEVSILGDGLEGCQGGSGMNAMGGTLRVHELQHPTDTIRHALKITIEAARNLYYDNETKKGYRWPARTHDSSADDPNIGYGVKRTTQVVPDLKMGALLALRSDVDIDKLGLKTDPGKLIALAFKDYGAYIVDDSAQDYVMNVAVERGNNGWFIDKFKENWGFDFMFNENWSADGATSNNDWANDWKIILENLCVVSNNEEGNIGGGGTPRRPLAPKLKNINNE